MKSKPPHIILLLLLLSSYVFMGTVAARELVIITAKSDVYAKFSTVELRRVFLGLSVRNINVPVLINKSDEFLYQVFLQKVMLMSARSFERKLLAKTFKDGGDRDIVYIDQDNLRESLQKNFGGISFMWKHEINEQGKINIVQEIWKE